MFNGIVESIGTISEMNMKNSCKEMKIVPDGVFSDLKVNDSIAVNGVCLTITHVGENQFNVVAVPETLRLTNLNQCGIGDRINLERPMKLSDRVGGHLVQGHVDGVGKIIHLQSQGDALLVTISMPPLLSNYIVKKGYIALDGMSITIVNVEKDSFDVTFIPHTQQITIVPHYQIGRFINIEVDILGKYVEKLFLGEKQNVIQH